MLLTVSLEEVGGVGKFFGAASAWDVGVKFSSVGKAEWAQPNFPHDFSRLLRTIAQSGEEPTNAGNRNQQGAQPRAQNHHCPYKSATPLPPTSASKTRDLRHPKSVTCHPTYP